MPNNIQFCEVEVKFDQSVKQGHYLFFKQHSAKKTEDDKPSERTLIICNIPPYINENHLKEVFIEFGKIENIFFSQLTSKTSSKPTVPDLSKEDKKFFGNAIKGFKSCFLVFSEANAMKNSLKTKTLTPFRCLGGLVGLEKWRQEYLHGITHEKDLIKNADDFMLRYDKVVEQREIEEKELAGLPDEDGWVKVTRKGNVPVAPRTELNETMLKIKAAKKRKSEEALHVYAFQNRESKREQIAHLRKKFEDDKTIIEQMRKNRKFKPF